MNRINKIDVHAIPVGQGGTRALVAAARMAHKNSWSNHAFYPNEVGGVDYIDVSAARRVHEFVSTNRLGTFLYNAFFAAARGAASQDHQFAQWAQVVSAQGNPVILCHEYLAEALVSADSKQPKILLTLNLELKPGERNIKDLDGIIVRSERAKEDLLMRGYLDEQIHVGTLVDSDISANRIYDFKRRAARLSLCQYMRDSKDLRRLFSDIAPSNVSSDVAYLREDYRGRFTVALITSASGHNPNPIKEVIRSFQEPLESGLVNLVLIGGQNHTNAPMNVAYAEAIRLGITPKKTKAYSPDLEGFQIVYNTDTKELVDSSFKLIRRAEVVLLTRATDIIGATVVAAAPSFVGTWCGSHELADRRGALRTEDGILAYDWLSRSEGGWSQTWPMIFKYAKMPESNPRSMLRVANNLFRVGGTKHYSNQDILQFIGGRIESVYSQ